jgi:hypothetical protein
MPSPGSIGTVRAGALAALLTVTPASSLIPARSGLAAGAFSGDVPCSFDEFSLSEEAASGFAGIALECVRREFPNKTGHVMGDSTEVARPAVLHPAFYGCFDWHSAVHGHWMLVRLLVLFPDLPEAEEIVRALDRNLTVEKLAAEADYFEQENRASFERTYGWAWLLKLAGETRRCPLEAARRWERNLQPLVEVIVSRYLSFIPKQTYPIKRGVHPNTAFGLSFALDFARATGNAELEDLAAGAARRYFLRVGEDGCPGGWEPDGDDFFSPCLMIADLMRRVLPGDDFSSWLDGFLPGLSRGRPQSLLRPAEVSDRSDPKIVHLDGLNLSRAWCMRGIAGALRDGDPRRAILEEAACRHASQALAHVASGHYEGEHWLASFAVLLLSGE